MSERDSVDLGRQAAEQQGVFGWGFFGCALAILAIPIVYIRSPKLPTELIPSDKDIDTRSFEVSFVNRLKKRQIKAAWIGFLISIGLWWILWIQIFTVAKLVDLPVEQGEAVEEVTQKKVPKPDRTVTLAEFNRIKDGMSYKEVVAIIGFEGTVMSETTVMGTRTVMYSWENRGFSNMNAMFQGDKLMSKAQLGLR